MLDEYEVVYDGGCPIVSPPAAAGAIAFDAASEATPVCAASISWSHTVAAGSNRILVVGISWRNGVTVSGVTFNGDPLAQVPGFAVNNTNQRVDAWYMVAPDETTGTIEVTMSGSAFDLGAGAASYTGVSQGSPFGTAATNTGTGTSATVSVPSDAGEYVFGVVSYTDGTSGGNTTASGNALWTNWTDCQNGTECNGQYVTTEDPTLTWSGLNTEWACAGVPLRVA